MLKSIAIQDLRGIRTGQLLNLTELNVIVGPNNSGKSTILDAILLGANPNPGRAFGDLLARRTVLEVGNWLVRRATRQEPKFAQIAVQVGSLSRTTRILRGPQRLDTDGSALELEFWQQHILVDDPKAFMEDSDSNSHQRGFTKYGPGDEPPSLPVSAIRLMDPVPRYNHTQLAELWSRTSESGFQNQAKELIRAVIPDLQDIQVLSQKNQPVLYLFFSGVVHPIGLAGEGIILLTRLLCELATTTGGIALLEEPETHLHPAAMHQVAKALYEASKRGIQIFLTTHSLDLIDHLLAAFPESEIDQISVYGIVLKDGELKSSHLTGSEAALSRTQLEADLR
jgi:energy-coupling factor transporter ATP-binding protein EcfA2